MTETDMEADQLDSLKTSFEVMFYSHHEQDSGHQLRTVSKYFEYLADTIDHEGIRISADRSLLAKFESVQMLLRKVLQLYPVDVRSQLEDLLNESKAAERLATLLMLTDFDLYRIRYGNRRGLLSSLARRSERSSDEGQFGISKRTLFELRRALQRSAGVLQYAAGIEVNEDVDDISDLSEMFDPSFVDKVRVLALLGILRDQLVGVSDGSRSTLLLERLDRLEAEIRRPKPRWSLVIASLFMMLGAVADLKTVAPSIYSAPERTIWTLIQVIHEGGQAHQHRHGDQPLLGSPFDEPAALPAGGDFEIIEESEEESL